MPTLYRILEEHKVQRVSTKIDKSQWQEICGLYLAGWKMDDIAEELGTTRQNIGRIVKTCGISHKDTAKNRLQNQKRCDKCWIIVRKKENTIFHEYN